MDFIRTYWLGITLVGTAIMVPIYFSSRMERQNRDSARGADEIMGELSGENRESVLKVLRPLREIVDNEQATYTGRTIRNLLYKYDRPSWN